MSVATTPMINSCNEKFEVVLSVAIESDVESDVDPALLMFLKPQLYVIPFVLNGAICALKIDVPPWQKRVSFGLR